jgi:hypothetical protein
MGGKGGDQNVQNALKHLIFVSTSAPKRKKKFFIYIIDFRFLDLVNSEDPVNNVHIDWIFRINQIQISKIYNIDKQTFFSLGGICTHKN